MDALNSGVSLKDAAMIRSYLTKSSQRGGNPRIGVKSLTKVRSQDRDLAR